MVEVCHLGGRPMRLHSFRLYPFARKSHQSSRRVEAIISEHSIKRRVFSLTLVLIMFALQFGRFVTLAECSVMASNAVSAVATTTTGPWFDLVHLFKRFFGKTARPQETLADRNNRVARINVSPGKWVGYVGDNVTFVAAGTDATGEAVQ